MRARWAAAVVATVVTSVMAGCGGSGSSTAVDGPASSASGTASSDPRPSERPGEEPGCPYLTAEQVSTAVGSPTSETAGTVHACFFDPAGEGPSVMLSRVDIQIDPADYARQTKALCRGEVTDVEAGDDAFVCVMGLGPQGQLYQGRVLVTVSVNDAADDATGIAAAAALLPEVTIPPKGD